MTTGRLHSIESFGAVDGPGIRTVFFLQGCPARCAYCHNPDTWDYCGGKEITVEEVLRWAKRGKAFYGEKGGVTFSGGEPLLQGQFLLEAMSRLKKEGIKTAIDASGTYFDEFTEEVIAESDMVLLDVKHIQPGRFRELTGLQQEALFRLIEVINRLDKPVWIRQVIVPGFNDSEEYIQDLNEFMKQIKPIKKVELLGYHNMAEPKYEKLGIGYRLKGVEPMDAKRLEELSLLTAI